MVRKGKGKLICNLRLIIFTFSHSDTRAHLLPSPFAAGVPFSISDEPLYPWRGVMIDTANHYLSIDLIKETLDLMSFHKFNVLHWHMIDSYSFPLEVRFLLNANIYFWLLSSAVHF